MPAVSNDTIKRGTISDTYFKIPRAGDFIGTNFDKFEPILWREVKKFKYYETSGFWPATGRMDLLSKNIIAPILVYDPETGKAGVRGVMTNHRDPTNPKQRICTSIATGQYHEFMHCFAGLKDEYYKAGSPQETVGYTSSLESRYWTNTTLNPKCDSLPWKYLLPGGTINKGTDSLIGAFGFGDNQYHPELKCLMNGTFSNISKFGGDGQLRVPHLCNFCTELAVYRLVERIGNLSDNATSAVVWRQNYRQKYYDTFGFDVPDTVPQTNSDGKAFYMPCRQ
jgi:hypothetical protein